VYTSPWDLTLKLIWIIPAIIAIKAVDSTYYLIIGGIIYFCLFLWYFVKYHNELATYLYLHETLEVPIKYREAKHYKFLLHPESRDTWYPLDELRGIPTPYRKKYLELFALLVEGESDPSIFVKLGLERSVIEQELKMLSKAYNRQV